MRNGLRLRVYPYRRGSRSATAIARALGGKRIRFESSPYLGPRYTVINWGASECPYPRDGERVLNPADKVTVAGNKLLTFRVLKAANVSIPEFADHRDGVSWGGASATVVRHKLRGQGGDGIEIIEKEQQLPSAPLYVQYIKKQEEYRVHVVNDRSILVQRKARRLDGNETTDWRIRNHSKGFVFVRHIESIPDAIQEEAKKSIKALGLDFCAVDIIWNDRNQKAYVLEVNCAPGLEGSTIADYKRGFEEFLKYA